MGSAFATKDAFANRKRQRSWVMVEVKLAVGVKKLTIPFVMFFQICVCIACESKKG
jgi:hypothetical protein